MVPIFDGQLKEWRSSTSSTVPIESTTSVPMTLLLLVEKLATRVLPDVLEDQETTMFPDVDGVEQPAVDYSWFAVSIFVVYQVFLCVFSWTGVDEKDVVFVVLFLCCAVPLFDSFI